MAKSRRLSFPTFSSLCRQYDLLGVAVLRLLPHFLSCATSGCRSLDRHRTNLLFHCHFTSGKSIGPPLSPVFHCFSYLIICRAAAAACTHLALILAIVHSPSFILASFASFVSCCDSSPFVVLDLHRCRHHLYLLHTFFSIAA